MRRAGPHGNGKSGVPREPYPYLVRHIANLEALMIELDLHNITLAPQTHNDLRGHRLANSTSSAWIFGSAAWAAFSPSRIASCRFVKSPEAMYSTFGWMTTSARDS